MDKYQRFKEAAKTAAEQFRRIDSGEPIKVITHFDCDGICAGSILVRALMDLNRKHSLSIVPGLTEEFLQELPKEDFNYYVFTDIGSGQIDMIVRHLKGKNVFILDHHEFNENPSEIIHLNPHLFGIDGGQEISGAGVSYFFSQHLTASPLAHIAIIGAIGDVQDKEGFSQLNQEILEKAVLDKKIKVIKGLRFFGAQTRPLHKVLEYSSDTYIPGVTGSESGAIQFLHQIGIDPKHENGWKKIVHLTDDEIKKLTASIVMRRVDEKHPEDVLTDVYILKDEKKESPFRDVKEFSTLLNACGRMDRAAVGVNCCLDDEKAKKKALQTLADYRKEIVGGLRWFEEHEDSEFVHTEDSYVLINAQDQIRYTIIGTISSILSKSNRFKDGTYILSIAHGPDGFTKASIRVAGDGNGHDVRKIIQGISENIRDCEAGGHGQAAGATFPTTEERLFLEEAKKVLKRL